MDLSRWKIIVLFVFLFVASFGSAAFYIKRALPIKEAKKVIESGLYDPDSAQFRNMGIGEHFVCGEVNAKNRFGAFVGFKAFAVYPSGRVILDGDDGPEGFTQRISIAFCSRSLHGKSP